MKVALDREKNKTLFCFLVELEKGHCFQWSYSWLHQCDSHWICGLKTHSALPQEKEITFTSCISYLSVFQALQFLVLLMNNSTRLAFDNYCRLSHYYKGVCRFLVVFFLLLVLVVLFFGFVAFLGFVAFFVCFFVCFYIIVIQRKVLF